MTNNNEDKRDSNLETNAVALSDDAKSIIGKIYKDFYGTHAFIENNILIEIINKSFILSLQKIEERPINAKIIIIDDSKWDKGFPKGTLFINFKEDIISNLKFQTIKKYIGITEEINVCLVIKIQESIFGDVGDFKLKGLLIFDKSIPSFASQFQLWSLKPDKYEKHLDCIYNSLLIAISQGKILLSFLNNELLTIEKGKISHHPNISKFISLLFERSNLYSIIERYEEEELPNLYDSYYTAFHNIFSKISKDRHGSILIFCYNGEINDEKYFHPNAIEIKIPIMTFLQKIKEKKVNPLNEKDIKNIIKMYEKGIISLSKTDGALIFNEDLDLILAGAFLKVDISSSIGGARRRTAETFTKKIEKMGVSISQDGTITLFDSFPKKDSDIVFKDWLS